MSYRFRQYSQNILKQEKLFFKAKKSASISSVIIYPNSYEIGINNLGYQSVYRLLNQIDAVYAERAFLYPSPFQNMALTLESNRSIAEFDIVAFSLAFELDYINLVRILKNASIPLYSWQRDHSHPLIVAGGMTMLMNPKPVSPFLDVIFIGEAEGLVEAFVAMLDKARIDSWSRKRILHELAKIKGLYIPQIHNSAMPECIERHNRTNNDSVNVSALMTQSGAFRDMFLIEVGRGCPRGCRFCAAGYVYRPYRIKRLNTIKQGLKNYDLRNKNVGLVGSAISDYPELTDLMQFILAEKGRLGISSFRVDELNGINMELFEKSALRSVSVAPEAGSERLRKIIGKDISEMEILHGARLVAHSRLATLKLYFMIGLPFEEDQDITAFIELGARINEIFNEKQATGVAKISCNAFIPKAFTPFQWAPMAKEEEITAKRRYLKKMFKEFNKVQFNTAKSTREDLLQGILSLGDHQTAKLIDLLVNEKKNWNRAAAEIEYDYQAVIHRPKNYEEALPWDVIRGTVPKAYLWREYMDAKTIARATSQHQHAEIEYLDI